jgi:glycerol-3-phosphate dehydrogenase
MAVLSPAARAAALETLPGIDLDLLVIGGGITGAGIARDAAERGLAVALIEAVDFAAGTSSRSSKLIHGGVRYLAQGDVGLVREAANERAVLRRIAPHLCTPVQMVMPTYRRSTHMKLAAGLWAFEKLATIEPADRHRMLDRDAAVREEPTLAPDGLHGAATYVEYLTDDARLVLSNVQSAAAAGAHCVNHVEVTGLDGRTVQLRDALDGRQLTARARIVVNAAGPWVDELRERAHALSGRRVQLTKGIHLVVDHARLPLRHVVVMNARDKRPVFAVPRDGITYLGTTDTHYTAPTLEPGVTADDVDYLLDAANRTFAGAPLARADVLGSWAGLRPLLQEPGKAPSDISRKDEIMIDEASGLVTIAGGKLTAYRRMAERVVDLVYERLGRTPPPCPTGETPLAGGEGPADVSKLAAAFPALSGLAIARLARHHGAGCEALVARVQRDARAAEPVPGLPGMPRAEIEHALDAEMALTLEDVLARRTRVLLFTHDQGLGGVEAVADMAAERLGWSAARRDDEITRYRRLAADARSFR